jgi:hydrogenase small subunit
MGASDGAGPEKTPAQRLLDQLGPVDNFRDRSEYGDFGLPAGVTLEELLEPETVAGPKSRLGPLEKVHVLWFSGMSCDGCTVSVTGAQAPALEGLLMGAHPGMPRVVLHHPVVNLESGPNYLRAHEQALRGELDAPYAIVLEGSISDETVAHAYGGCWAGNGEEPWGPDGEERPVSADEWIARLAPGAAAAIAVAYAVTDEWHQTAVAGRHGTPVDVLIDAAGAGIAAVLVMRRRV